MASNEISLEEEYRKPTGIRPADISRLRDWLKTQPHLPADHITDLDLILAYHCCGRSSEVTKQLLDLNCTLRTLFTGFFKDRVLEPRVYQVMDLVLITILPQRTKEGYAVFYVTFLDKDPKKFSFPDACRTGLMNLDIWQRIEGTWPGFVIIFDLERMSLGHMAKLDVQHIQQYLYYLQEGMFVNLKGMHFSNAPSFMDRLMLLLRPFLKKPLLEILHIHQVGSKTLDQFVPIENLPIDAGGTGDTFKELREDMIKKMNDNKKYFEAENLRRVDEKLRPGKPKTISDIFGSVEGSFKKLEID